MTVAGEPGKEKNEHFTICLHLTVIVLLSCTACLYFLKLNPNHLLLFDDSYITLQFAANLFKYGGITYDGSSYFIGATSPLHIMCVALLGLFLKMETASLAVGIVFFILSCLMVYLWSLRLYDKQTALLAGLMMSICYWLVADALNGLETTCFIFFSLLTFSLFHRYPQRQVYVLPLFLSITTRPEGWFVACALFTWQALSCAVRKDEKILRHLLVALSLFMLLIIPYVIVLFSYTGSLLPSTAFSKALFFAEVRLPLINRMIFFRNGLLTFYNNLLCPGFFFILPLILFARRVITLYYFWVYFFVFYIFYFLFCPGAVGHYWFRYQHIFIPVLIMGIAGGVVEMSRMLTRRMFGVALGGLLVLVIIYCQGLAIGYLKFAYPVAVLQVRSQIDLALWFKNHTPRGTLIALHDIGAVGYFSERDIIDLVGLINPEIRRYYWDAKTKKPLPLRERRVMDYLKVKKPDYVVLNPEWDRYFNFAQPENRHYFTYQNNIPAAGYHVFACNWPG